MAWLLVFLDEERMKFRILLFVVLFAGMVKDVSAQQISGSWTGTLEVGGSKLNIVFNFLKDTTGCDVCTMDSPDQSVKGIRTSLSYFSEDSLSLSVPVVGITYSGRLRNGVIQGVFEQNGMKFPLNLTMGHPVYKRPQTPQPPFPYVMEDVTFENITAHVTLAGTLTYPVGYQAGDRVPVALMVTGSGPQNRDSELYEHKTFLVIADFLARHGIATLRYDDRAVGKSTGHHQAANSREVADDAQAGINILRLMGSFSKVGIVGHSEGANVAFMLGAQHLIDFAVCMAPIGLKGIDGLYEQGRKIAEASGQTYPMTKEQLRDYLLKQQNSWFIYFLDYDPAEDVRRTTCPVFLLNGDRDMQVIASSSVPAIIQNLPKNEKSSVKIYPGLNHLFQPCTTGLPTEYSTIEQTISPEVLQDMTNWILAL